VSFFVITLNVASFLKSYFNKNKTINFNTIYLLNFAKNQFL
jgi:hypothetical protein